jgi:hypothetical protein
MYGKQRIDRAIDPVISEREREKKEKWFRGVDDH